MIHMSNILINELIYSESTQNLLLTNNLGDPSFSIHVPEFRLQKNNWLKMKRYIQEDIRYIWPEIYIHPSIPTKQIITVAPPSTIYVPDVHHTHCTYVVWVVLNIYIYVLNIDNKEQCVNNNYSMWPFDQLLSQAP